MTVSSKNTKNSYTNIYIKEGRHCVFCWVAEWGGCSSVHLCVFCGKHQNITTQHQCCGDLTWWSFDTATMEGFRMKDIRKHEAKYADLSLNSWFTNKVYTTQSIWILYLIYILPKENISNVKMCFLILNLISAAGFNNDSDSSLSIYSKCVRQRKITWDAVFVLVHVSKRISARGSISP